MALRTHLLLWTWILSLAAGGSGGSVMAEPIALDPAFGQGGITEIAMPSLPSADRVTRTRSYAQMADGRLVLLAQASTTMALVRLMPNGVLDMSFGSGGQVTFVGEMSGADVLVQPDGKILVAAKGASATVRRLLMDGSLDVSFSGDGIYELPTSGPADTVVTPSRLCLQPDGKLLVTAGVQPRYAADWMIVRLRMDGTPDTTWGTAGVVKRAAQTTVLDGISGLGLQSDGRVVISGESHTLDGSGGDIVALRFLTTGVLDTTFATNGQLVHSLGTRTEKAFDMAVQSDDKVIVLASAYIIPPSREQSCVLRLTAAGALDTTFDGDGRVNVTLGTSSDYVSAVEVDASGRVMIVGSQYDTFQSPNRLAVARLTTAGALDTTFDGDGIAVLNPAKNLGYGTGLALQADGDWIVAGQQMYQYGNPPTDVAAIRINADGSLDNAYGVDGVFAKDLGIYEQLAQAQDVALLADGGLLLAGKAQGIDSSDQWLGVARLLPNGQVDSTYGNQGTLSLMQMGVANCLVIQPDGKALVGGASKTPGAGFAVMRLSAQGVPDSGFGTGGIASFDLAVFGESLREMQVQADGKILLAGHAEPGFLLMRLLANGTRDTAFGTNGTVVTNIGNSSSQAQSMAVQADGKIVLAGLTRLENSDVALALTRHSAEGVLDTTFSGDGIQTLSISGSYWTEANDVVVQPDGKILVAATTYQAAAMVDAMLVRYHANGTLDETFGNYGIMRISPQIGDTRPCCMELLANGDVVVAGSLNRYPQNFWFLARVDSAGQLTAPLSLQPGPVRANTPWQDVTGGKGMLVDSAGNLVVAGGNQRNMVLMRFLGGSGSLFHSYAAWAAHHFTVAELLSPLSTAAEDFDGDGQSNLLEHVMGSPPKSAGALPPSDVGVIPWSGGRNVTYSFTYPVSLPQNATLVIESSSTLQPDAIWTPMAIRQEGHYWSPGSVSEELQSDGSRRATGSFNFPLDTNRVFFRLRVESP